ncbi:Hypothetical protein P9211_13671 [Prochlorococcus marinus str. MIT 9211]|uniref:NAD(P)H-quinone oxidoreductase NdhF subunit n=1 Tax=Prochlorococcus marinus (strain MIT 9211) TaxID=93059 RepID=A9BBT6_PROM4|nr:Hypothetical protein P9211_13671 [Prochlorococcus marinus str. MIT 9211]
MPSLIDVSWLIPISPLVCATLIGVLLLSFNRTMNRLTKPVSFFIINSIILSTLISFLLILNHQSGTPINWHLKLLSYEIKLNLRFDYISEISSLATGLFLILTLTLSYFRLPRAKGYVRYVTLLCFASGLLFLLILGTDLTQSTFHDFFA